MNIDNTYIATMWKNWLPGAMYPSEIAWLTKQLVEHRVEVLIECGRQDAVSTKCFGELLAPHSIAIYSVDFDENKENLEKAKRSLSGLNVVCVSGDIHLHVPKLLEQHRGKRIAVLQDGPKGWEGLSTLIAAAHSEDVVLIAQHNLHKGHESRSYFSLIACNPPFLEFDASATQARELRGREMEDAAFRASNREVDHSSLGICSLAGPLRAGVMDNLEAADWLMGPWSAKKTAEEWKAGNLDHVSKLRARQRFSWYRFKAR